MNFDKALFAERLREARKRTNMTQGKFGDVCEIPQSAVSNYENGKHGSTPNLNDAARMADVLGVSLDWLCGFDDVSRIITPLQWLIYLDRLLCNPPKYAGNRAIHLKMGADGMELAFIGQELNDFMTAYSALFHVRDKLGEAYHDAINAILQKNCEIFTPGYENAQIAQKILEKNEENRRKSLGSMMGG